MQHKVLEQLSITVELENIENHEKTKKMGGSNFLAKTRIVRPIKLTGTIDEPSSQLSKQKQFLTIPSEDRKNNSVLVSPKKRQMSAAKKSNEK